MNKVVVDPSGVVPVLELLPSFPILLVSTRTNVLTVNQVHYFSFRPLRLGVAIARARHSFRLIQEEGEFVINVPDKDMLDAVRACGKLSGRDGSKFEATGLTPIPSAVVAAVSVAECLAHIECRVSREILFEDRVWFIGDVVAARRAADWSGERGLLCGRHAYGTQGEDVAPR